MCLRLFISISCFADLVKHYFCFTDACVASVYNRNILMCNVFHIDFIVNAVVHNLVCSASNALKWVNLYVFILFFTS